MNLKEILKDCPAGTELWSPLFGLGALIDVVVAKERFPIHVQFKKDDGEKEIRTFSSSGVYFDQYEGAECALFPSRDNRDWSTFKAERPKFDVSSMRPFDKVLVRENKDTPWTCDIFSYLNDKLLFKYQCISDAYSENCIPYNEETKHLVGTTDEAPEFYRL